MPVFPRDPKPRTNVPPGKPTYDPKPNKDDKRTDAPSTLPRRKK